MEKKTTPTQTEIDMAKPNFKNKPKEKKGKKSLNKTKKRKEDPRLGLYNQLVQCNARVNDLRAMNGNATRDSGGASVSALDDFLFDRSII